MAEPRVTGITPAALRCLRHYPFPGNVRELSNAIERAVAFARGEEVDIDDLPERIRSYRGAGQAVDRATFDEPIEVQQLLPLKDVERRYVRYVLERLEGNKRRTAELLGIGRRTLYRYLEDDD